MWCLTWVESSYSKARRLNMKSNQLEAMRDMHSLHGTDTSTKQKSRNLMQTKWPQMIQFSSESLLTATLSFPWPLQIWSKLQRTLRNFTLGYVSSSTLKTRARTLKETLWLTKNSIRFMRNIPQSARFQSIESAINKPEMHIMPVIESRRCIQERNIVCKSILTWDWFRAGTKSWKNTWLSVQTHQNQSFLSIQEVTREKSLSSQKTSRAHWQCV